MTSSSMLQNHNISSLRMLRLADRFAADAIEMSTRPFPREPSSNLRDSRPTNLLINGCGRTGTHAVVGLLRRHGIRALHEGHGKEVTVGWPYTGRWRRWSDIWPMSAQPRPSDAHDPIFKVHRHPLAAIPSMAVGMTQSGGCMNPSERRWDARSWYCATRFVPLPISQARIASQKTCDITLKARLNLAMHYWVKWNLLADRWATKTFAIENLTIGDIVDSWCLHCAQQATCLCPVSAEAVQRNQSTKGERVHPQRGHGKTHMHLTWDDLATVDADMSRVARKMAIEYGYT